MKLKPKVARWLDYIGQFSFHIEHHAGTSDEMALPDILSRTFSPKESDPVSVAKIMTMDSNGNDSPLKAELWFKVWKSSGLRLNELIEAQNEDEALMKLSGEYKCLNKKEYNVVTRLGVKMVEFRNRSLILLPQCMEQEVFEYCHLPYHYGQGSMRRVLRETFWITNMVEKVVNFTRRCEACLKVKAQKQDPSQPVMQTCSTNPWSSCHADLIGPMPRSYGGNAYVLVVVDSLTRFCDVEALPDKTAKSVIDGFVRMFSRRGPPCSLVVDNGREFSNGGLKELMLKYGCNLQFVTPLCPASNGLVERTNQKFKRYFRLWQADAINWEDHLHLACYVINHEYNHSIKTSSWNAFHGWCHQSGDVVNPKEIVSEYTDSQCAHYAYEHIQRMQKSLASLYETDFGQKKSRFQKLRTHYDNGNGSKLKLSPGDKVLIQTQQLKGHCAKLFISWRGVYVVHSHNERRRFLVHRRRIRKIWKDTEDSKPQVVDFEKDETDKNDKFKEVGNLVDEENELEEVVATEQVPDQVYLKPEGRLRSGKTY